MRDSQSVSIPNGLLSDLKEWVDDQLIDAGNNGKRRTDLIKLLDSVEIAESEAEQ